MDGLVSTTCAVHHVKCIDQTCRVFLGKQVDGQPIFFATFSRTTFDFLAFALNSTSVQMQRTLIDR